MRSYPHLLQIIFLLPYLPLLSLVSTQASAQSDIATPATLIVSGTIQKGSINPGKNDLIYAVQKSGETAGVGSVLDNNGFYSIQISKTTTFNGTELTLQLQKSGVRYQLLDSGNPVSFVFSGGLFPVTLSLDTSIGSAIGGSSSTTPSGGTPSSSTPTNTTPSNPAQTQFDSRFDVNNDGDFTQADIDLVKRAVASNQKSNTAADINSDRLLNTRDIIEIVKAYMQFIRSR